MGLRVMTTAYGRPALDALRHLVAMLKRDDPMTPVTVLVPNNIAGIVARRHLAAGFDGDRNGVAALYVTTLPRLAEQIASPILHPRRPAPNAVTAAAWRSALEDSPGCFERVMGHPATIRALMRAHRQLRDLSDAARDKARHATTLSPDLLRLHESVNARLAGEWYDATDLLTAAAHLVEEGPARTAEQGDTVLFLPQQLTQAEAAFARALGAAGLTVVAGLTGVERADRTVRRSVERLGGAVLDDGPAAPRASRVLHASDDDDEVRCIVRQIGTCLSRGTPANRVGVLYGASQPYARLLHEHLEAAGLAVNGPATRAVRERALARAFLGVLGLATTGLPRGATFTALAEATPGDLDGGTVKVATWERVSRAAGVLGGDDWLPRLEAYTGHHQATIDEQARSEEPSQARVEAAQREIDSARALAAFVQRLRDRLDEGLELTSWADLSEWALALFHDLYGGHRDLLRLPAEEQHAAAVIDGALRGVTSLAAFEPTARLGQLIDVIDLELETASPRVGRFGEGIFVGPVSAAVGLDLDAVFVVGLAEDTCPGQQHEDALLTERLRQATGGELDEARDLLDTTHRHVLAAFAGAQQVTASFPRGDLRRSTERLPSRFLMPTLRAITGRDGLAATDWDKSSTYERDTSGLLLTSRSFADTLRRTDQPSTGQEWRVRAASAGEDLDDQTVTAARALLTARAGHEFTRFDGNLDGVAGLPDYASGEPVVSPTALETFATCPQRFFVERLLRVQPLQDPEETIRIRAADVGTLIHETMDALLKEAEHHDTLPSYGEPWTPAHHQRLQEIAAEKASAFAARGVTGHPRLWQADKAQILQDLDRMLTEDSRWRAEKDAAVRGSELTFGMNGSDPVTITCAPGQILMRGSADKVDQSSHGTLYVTDIKSGRATKFKALEHDPVAAGSKLQLPVYAHAARREFAGDTVEAHYWFVRGADAGTRIPVLLTADLEQRYAETLTTLVTSIARGMFLGRPSEKPAWGYVDCHYCTPDGIGHEEARARYLRKRTSPLLQPLMALTDPGAMTGDDQ